jgi:hypothetical protein
MSLSDTSIEQLAAVTNQSIIMEPIFAATTSGTLTAQLQEQLDKAVAARRGTLARYSPFPPFAGPGTSPRGTLEVVPVAPRSHLWPSRLQLTSISDFRAMPFLSRPVPSLVWYPGPVLSQESGCGIVGRKRICILRLTAN